MSVMWMNLSMVVPGDQRGSSAWTALLMSVRRSEEHTSELQSPCNLVCRLLLEKKNNLVIVVVWCTLPRAARAVCHTPSALRLLVCLRLAPLMAVAVFLQCTFLAPFLQVAMTRR